MSKGALYVVVVALLIMSLVAAAVFLGWRDRRQVEEGARVSATNIARLLETHVADTFDAVDISLRAVVRYHSGEMARGARDLSLLEPMLEELQSAQPHIEFLRVHDAQGYARFGSGRPWASTVSFADRDYFQKLRDDPAAGLVISKPTLGRASRQWGIALSRRLNGPDGSFAGMVSAVMTVDSFKKIFSDIDLGKRGQATLRDGNMGIVYRHPAPADLGTIIGDTRLSSEALKSLNAKAMEGVFVAASLSDGVERMHSWRRIRGYPYHVFVGLAVDEYLADWHHNMGLLATLLSLIVAGILAASRWLYRAEARIHESEVRWQFALEGSQEGVWDWDIAGKRIFFSPKYEENLGYQPGELGGSDTWAFTQLHPDDAAQVRATIEAHFSGQTPYYAAEFRMRHKDGNYRWVESRGKVVSRLPDGGPKRMIGTHRDITGRKNLDERLRLSEERLRQATDGAQIGTWYWDMATNKLEWSDLCRAQLALPPGKEPSLEHFWAVIHPEDRERVQRQVEKAVDEKSDYREEYRVVGTDGSVRWFSAPGRVYANPDGTLRGMGGVLLDITDRKEAERALLERTKLVALLNEQLARRAVDAETATRAKDAFLRNLSHELRTPLNHIIGGIDLLFRGAVDDKQRNWLQKIQASSRDLLRLVNELLDAARVEADELQLEEVEFAPLTVLEEACLMVSHRARAKGLALDLQTGKDLPHLVRGDATRLTQALLNYLDNAVKFTEAGSVTLSVQVLKSTQTEALVRFVVRDTGIGVAPEARTRLFTAFTQADSSTTRAHGGIGIGLSNVRAIARLMGGEVGFESEPGKGSAFWFTARLAIVPGASREASAPLSGQAAATPSVVDMEAARSALAELAIRLSTDDVRSGDCLRSSAALLGAAVGANEIVALQREIDRFEFPAALDRVRSIEAQIGGPQPSRPPSVDPPP